MSWEAVRLEATEMVLRDRFIESLVTSSILDHESFGEAIAYSLAQQFAGIISAMEWKILLRSVFKTGALYHEGMQSVELMGLKDLAATKARDPACDGLVTPFLYFKGYKAIQAHRIAHVLWRSDRKDAARAVSSRASELFGVDIHPAAVIGQYLLY